MPRNRYKYAFHRIQFGSVLPQHKGKKVDLLFFGQKTKILVAKKYMKLFIMNCNSILFDNSNE